MDATLTNRRRVTAAVRYVRTAGDAPVTLAELASAAGSSPFHFDRVFRRMMGRGAVRYARWLRLNAAAVALVRSKRPIIAIALSAGYANHESFSRAFRAQFNASPQAYRKRHRVPPPLRTDPTMKTLGVTLGHIKVPVTDLARSAAFYRDVLGLEEDFAVEQYGWAQYGAGDAAICLSVVGRSKFPTDDAVLGGPTARPGIDTGIQLRVTDARAAHAAIVQRGGKVGELHAGDDGSVGFGVADPDGNKLHVAQVPQPA
jgi:AraC-like DNA-binding protein/catechol 2,3-dioxygenase-like lactoylglutathione lyase family enzyme